MTYKLNPEVRKIESPVKLILPDMEKREYKDGAAVAEAVFNKRYLIRNLRAVDNSVEIELEEQTMPITNWIGEEQTFF